MNPMTAETVRPRRQYAKTAQRRADIVDAAMSVFAARGYHGGSLRDIARELDLSLTSLVHHFPSKSDLLEAVLEHADKQADWVEESLRDVGVKGTVLRLWEFNSGHPQLLRLLAIVAAEASAPDHPAHIWFVHRYQRVVTGLARAVEYDRAQGRIQGDTDPLDVARALTASWDGLQLQWLLDPSHDYKATLRMNLEQILER
jgi:AcrR family transcriptional regulator